MQRLGLALPVGAAAGSAFLDGFAELDHLVQLLHQPRLFESQCPGQRAQRGGQPVGQLLGLPRGGVEALAQLGDASASGIGQGATEFGQFLQTGQFVFAQPSHGFGQRAGQPGFDQLALAPQNGQARGHQHQLVGQLLHQFVGAAQARGVEIQVAAQHFQGGDLAQQLLLSLLEVLFRLLAADHRSGMHGDQADQLVDLGEIPPSYALWASEEQADQSDAGDAEQGLGDAGDGQGVGGFGRRLGQQGDYHGGEAAEHEGMGMREAHQRAAGRADRQPQRQGDDEGQGRLGEQRHDRHRDHGADGGADHLGEALLQRHAGQRGADDDDRHGRPLGLVEVEQERQVQRQQARDYGAQGKQQGVAAGMDDGAQVQQHG